MQAILISPNPDETDVLQVILKQAGFVVRTGNSLNQAIESWPENPAELILINLSGDHTKSLTQIKQLRAHTVVPILLISELLSDDLHVQYLEAGADLVALLSGDKVETEDRTLTVSLPVSVIRLAETISEQLGLSGQTDKMLAAMASQGVLNAIQGMGQQQQPGPVDQEAVESFKALSQTLNGLTGRLSKLEEMADAIDKANKAFTEPDAKDNEQLDISNWLRNWKGVAED